MSTPPDASDPEAGDGLDRRRRREAEAWNDRSSPGAPDRSPDAAAADDRPDDGSSGVGAGAPAPLSRRARKAAARRQQAKAKSPLRNQLEWVAVIVGAILVAVVIRAFVFQTFWIPSPSMATTLVKDDRVLVNKVSYKLHDVNRGDVVVFERPANEPESEVKDLIKRVVGLPGERVSILDGKVRIDGEVLDEPYVNGAETTYDFVCGAGDVTGIDTEEGMLVPDDTVFVMGDNRTNSHDGRCFGPIDQDLIVGRAFAIIWPPSKAGGL